jgi:hypothetical protein
MQPTENAEATRLVESASRRLNWKRWGPYLSERQWGTVREDYSATGDCWNYLPHDHARSRAYRWGEDGLLGLCDREGRLCFSVALWNGRDPILKERLFGLTNSEGNHGEDVKEHYFFLDSTPTHSYASALYKYPQAEFPYRRLLEENRRRGRSEPEFEIADTGIFDAGRYFDVTIEYAKASPDDILIRVIVANRGPDSAPLAVLPTLWFRNTWSWGRTGEGYWAKPSLRLAAPGIFEADHESLGHFRLEADRADLETLFTENETNAARLFNSANRTPFAKDAFHDFLIGGRRDAVNSEKSGTKAAFLHAMEVPPGGVVNLRLRLRLEAESSGPAFGRAFEDTFDLRRAEADSYYEKKIPNELSVEEKSVARQAYAGLLWSRQFYHFSVADWLLGDPDSFPPPPERQQGRDSGWRHLYNRDVISMPDTWEYPWYAAWDLAFHMIPMARIDPDFAKEQLVLLLREWFMHPNGQIPAYEFAFGDVNPPVHAWAAWRTYKMTGPRGKRDRLFLERVFQKLLFNFTWWVNRKDPDGRNLFAGGFLGLDNIGVFDRSSELPAGGHLEQADGTAWMAFYCGTMLSIALELASGDAAYEDVASKFFEHFVAIVDAMNELGGSGLWDDDDGFYYDHLHVDGSHVPLKVRSMVGLVPLFAVEVLEEDVLAKLPGFQKRLNWFLENRKDLSRHISYMASGAGHGRRLLAVPTRERLERVLRYLLDPAEFLSPHGIRSLSRVHGDHPYEVSIGGRDYRVAYDPAESTTGSFGGNSNWRGPVWFPVNYLLIEALERYHHFYGDEFRIECPTGSGNFRTLQEVASEIAARLASLFLTGQSGRRPCNGDDARFASDPHWKDLVLFHECFDGENGRGIGASHQTGWTALVTRCLEDMARRRR